MKETPTRLDYEIDDLTGPPLEVKQFVDNDVSIIEKTCHSVVICLKSMRSFI